MKQKVDKSFMTLIVRSPDIGDGWRGVTNHLMGLVRQKAKESPDLYEVRTVDKQMQVRLSNEGHTVWKYL